MNTLDIISTSIGTLGGILGAIAFFRDSFGSLKVIVEFEKGKDAYPAKNYIERHSYLNVKVVKKGRIKQSIMSATIESRILDPSHGQAINLNEYISLDMLRGAPLEQNEFRECKTDFISQGGGAMETVLIIHEIRVHVTDTRNKVYSSEWVNYNEYLLRNEKNPPLSEI